MEVTYTLTPEDLWAFQQFQARRKPVARLFNGFWAVVMPIVWLLSLWTNVRRLLFWQHMFGSLPLAWHFYWTYQQHSLLSFLLYTAAVAYFLWGIRFFFLRRQRMLLRPARPITMRLYSDAVLITATGQNNRQNWSDIREITGSRDHLFFYTGPAMALVVPKRAFADGAALAAFEAAARAFHSDPRAAVPTEAAPDVWPPPPVRAAAPPAPVTPEAADPPDTTQIAYVTRRADAWRSAVYTLVTHPRTLLTVLVPLLLSALYISFSLHAGLSGYVLALLLALLVTLLLVANHLRTQLAVRYPARDSARSCVSKIRPDAYVDISPNGRTVVRWRNVSAITLVWGDLYVRRRDGLGHYFIPRTAFPTRADAQAALETMRRCQQQAQAAPVTGEPPAPTPA